MPAPSDYRELLNILNRHKVKYLLVGAYAVMHYTEPRYTKDLDLLINSEPENAEKIYIALKEFGAPLKGISVDDFIKKGLVYQIGVEPVRVDIIMGIPGVDFNNAWQRRETAFFEDVKVNIMGIGDLIKSKKKIKRHTDMADIENLKYKQRLKRGKRQSWI